MTLFRSLVERLSSNLDLVTVGVFVAIVLGRSAVSPSGQVGLLLALPLLFVLPGYVTVALLLSNRRTDDSAATSKMVFSLERAALSVGVSLALLPFFAFAVYLSSWPFASTQVVWAVSAYVSVGLTLAAIRRWSRPARDRSRSASPSTWRSLAAAPTRLAPSDLAINGLLALSVLVATGALGAALVAPNDGSTTTSFYLLSSNETRPVATDYPETLEAGDRARVTIGITNHEQRTVEYTVVAELQRVQFEERSATVTDRAVVGRFHPRLAHNETWQKQHSVDPALSGENIRLAYYLYRGEAPETPTEDTAYRRLYLQLNVSEAN